LHGDKSGGADNRPYLCTVDRDIGEEKRKEEGEICMVMGVDEHLEVRI
jgi:hypothetical protein